MEQNINLIVENKKNTNVNQSINESIIKKIEEKFPYNLISDNRINIQLNMEELIEIDPLIPSVQRLAHADKIKDIVSYQEEYFRKFKHFNYLGVININYCIENDKYYLIDGQHRYQSIKMLVSKGYRNNQISLELVIVENLEELKENYELINKNTPLPEFRYQDSVNIINETLQLFKIHFDSDYDQIFSSSTRCHRPKISRNRFEEALEYLVIKLDINSPNKLFEMIMKINKQLSKWKMENFPEINVSNPTKLLNTCREFNFFLGLYKYKAEDYCFDWVRLIILNEKGENIAVKKKVSKRKKTIPKNIKNMVWDRYFGENVGKHLCFCCNKNWIRQNSFEAGHFIAESKGGETNVENLRPICKECNGSMGSKDMGEFMKEFGLD